MRQTAVRVALMAGVGLAVAVLLPIMGLTREREREIRLVAVDRAFHLEGDRQPNPTLRLRAGERVTVVLRNEDDGMRHDFTIKAWGVAVPAIDGRGERTVTFRVPGTRGSASYGCTPHPVSMRGAIVVE